MGYCAGWIVGKVDSELGALIKAVIAVVAVSAVATGAVVAAAVLAVWEVAI